MPHRLMEPLDSRLLLAGGLDATFNGGGDSLTTEPIKVDFAGGEEQIEDVVSYPDGKILVCGQQNGEILPDNASPFNFSAMGRQRQRHLHRDTARRRGARPGRLVRYWKNPRQLQRSSSVDHT